MRIPVLRTLSARILLGFAVLIITFGAVTVNQVVNLTRLTRSIHSVQEVYVPLARNAKELEVLQRDLTNYLDEFRSESTRLRVEARIRGFRANRARLLRDLRAIIDDFDDLPKGHDTAVAQVHRYLNEIDQIIRSNDPAWASLLAAPPVANAEEDPVALSALGHLRESEGRLYAVVLRFEDWQQQVVDAATNHLVVAESQIRRFVILLGSLPTLLGIGIMVWAVVALRSLRSLQAAAKNIAAGNYASRLDESGPGEVADLAREFNVMAGAIEERERDLIRSERLATVGVMAATITHEVRNPLSAIGLNTELLEEELADVGANDEAKSLCGAIQKEVDRLTDITEEYLTFARLPKPKLHPHDLNSIVENMVGFQREQVEARGVELDMSLAKAVPRIQMDDGQVRQALLNLIRNAADAVAETGGGRVSIETRMAGRDHVELSVSDDGPGMTRELAGKVFDPFFSTKDGGTGLGLALVQQIVHEHGGTIRVGSEPGHGATFVVSLPA